MVSSNIFEPFSIEINEEIIIDKDGNATSKRDYTFYNSWDKKIRLRNLFWMQEFSPNAYEIYLIKKDGSKDRLHLKDYDKCPWCEGKEVRQGQNCIACNGTGRVGTPNHIDIPLIEDTEKIIAPKEQIEATIEYKQTDFAEKLNKNWMFRYFFENKLKKVALNLKIELPTLGESWVPGLNKLCKEMRVDFGNRKLIKNGNTFTGQFSDVSVLVNGIFYYGSKEWVEKWWVGWVKAILIGIIGGIIGIIIFELYLRKMIL